MKQKNKRFVIYISGQNDQSMPFTVRRNDFDFKFEFTRTNTGEFSVSNFDPKKHRIIGTPHQLNADVFTHTDGDIWMITTVNGVNSDYAFEFGGYLEIEEFATILL